MRKTQGVINGCELEIIEFDNRKWYSFGGLFVSVSTAIKFDINTYFTFKDGVIVKISPEKVNHNLKSRRKRLVDCQDVVAAKRWMINAFEKEQKFKTEKAFVTRFLEIALRSVKKDV
jgi:hypothetical protein